MVLLNAVQSSPLLFGLCQLHAKLLLLLPGDVTRYRAVHGLVGPLVAFALDGMNPLVKSRRLVFGDLCVVPEICQQVGFQPGDGLLIHVFGAPLPGNSRLDLLGCQVRQITAVLVGVASQAEPVGVFVPTPAFGYPEDQF